VESRFIPVASLQRGLDNPGDLVGGVSRFATNIIIRSRWQTCELVTRWSGTITGNRNSDIVMVAMVKMTVMVVVVMSVVVAVMMMIVVISMVMMMMVTMIIATTINLIDIMIVGGPVIT
jgi:hypothetical protein